ncbi:hypothetical protein VNO78_20836 [Psophocarpus tetragonolobus]|uniref:Uncharacterized protein n=1 Tax=Psophocarpus tetragonolobus TaxID=3891 RepID=A0AAN9SFG3_PSOTE
MLVSVQMNLCLILEAEDWFDQHLNGVLTERKEGSQGGPRYNTFPSLYFLHPILSLFPHSFQLIKQLSPPIDFPFSIEAMCLGA